MRRVVVTGLGMVSPLGVGVGESWSRLIRGESGVRSLKGRQQGCFDQLPCTIAATVPQQQLDMHRHTQLVNERTMATFIQYAMIAAQEALIDANWFPRESIDRDRTGVAVGSGIGGIEDIIDASIHIQQQTLRKVSPYFVPRMLVNMAAGHISIRHGFRGPNHSVATACATGAHSVGDAMRFIQFDDADVMVAGGAESTIDLVSLAGFLRTHALTTAFNDCPEKASRPFDKRRSGFVVGEGAGILILEELEHAIRRGAPVYAEIVGYGLSGDAFHVTAPSADGSGASLSMQRALFHAKLSASDIDYINAHATSTPLGDAVEHAAIKRVFGNNATHLSVSSSKGSIGHLLGAAGAVEAIFTVLAVHHQLVPPTLNLEAVDDPAVFDLDYVPDRGRSRLVRAALSNSFGFGGTNATLCFRRWSTETVTT